MNFEFSPAAIPRHWLADSMLSTALANSLNLIFPAGERFFIRSVKHYENELPEALQKRVKTFYGQEVKACSGVITT